MTAFKLKRPPLPLPCFLFLPAPIGHGLDGYGGQHIRELGHMGAAGRPAEAVLVGLPEVAQQVHADKSAIIGRDGRAFLIVGSCIVVGPGGRSEERRVGKGGVSSCRSWWSPSHSKKKLS